MTGRDRQHRGLDRERTTGGRSGDPFRFGSFDRPVRLARRRAAGDARGWSGPGFQIDNERGELIIGLYNAHGLGGMFADTLLTFDATVSAAAATGITPINLAASSTDGFASAKK